SRRAPGLRCVPRAINLLSIDTNWDQRSVKNRADPPAEIETPDRGRGGRYGRDETGIAFPAWRSRLRRRSTHSIRSRVERPGTSRQLPRHSSWTAPKRENAPHHCRAPRQSEAVVEQRSTHHVPPPVSLCKPDARLCLAHRLHILTQIPLTMRTLEMNALNLL